MDPSSLPRAVDALCRREFQPFLERAFHTLDPNKPLQRAEYLETLCHHLEKVATGEIRRLIVTIPPRHLKSISTAVALPAWMLGRDPTARIICVSYGEDLALAHARNFRTLMRTGWYDAVFPGVMGGARRDTDRQLTTDLGGFRIAATLGGALTGLGADILIIDDLMKAIDANSPAERERAQRWFDETLLSRLNDQATGRIIVIQQRLHEDDIVGYLLEKSGFTHLNLPAIAESEEAHPLGGGRVFRRSPGDILNPSQPLPVLEDMRREMGSRVFQAQYQQNPTPTESDLIRWDRIATYDKAPERHQLQYVLHSWDTAIVDGPKADYSVGTIWGYSFDSWLLLDVIRMRLAYPDLLAKVRFERAKWQADGILVEKAGTGHTLLQDLGRDFKGTSPDPRHHAPRCQRFASRPKIGKEERLASQVERLYSGMARLPVDAPWLPELKRELVSFPASRYDDQVDSVSQFLEWGSSPWGRLAIRGNSREPSTPRRP